MRILEGVCRCFYLFKQLFVFIRGVFKACLPVCFSCLFFLRTDQNIYICRRFIHNMFDWFFKKKDKHPAESVKKGFDAVKKDFDKVGTWIKHLDEHDKQLFDAINSLKSEISSIRDEIEGLREGLSVVDFEVKNKQLLKKTGVSQKQTAVEDVQEDVQTPVQTGNLYQVLNDLSANERLLIFTLMNAGEGLKLSYEDLARLLGKERSTVRGQINAIKQKSEGLLQEITEPSGKKRVYVSEEVRNKLLKYAKVRVRKDEKDDKKRKKQQKSENSEEDLYEDEIMGESE